MAKLEDGKSEVKALPPIDVTERYGKMLGDSPDVVDPVDAAVAEVEELTIALRQARVNERRARASRAGRIPGKPY